MYTALQRHWMNGKLWQNDPDCAMARNCATEEEKYMFGDNFLGIDISKYAYGLSHNEADTWSKCLWILDEMILLSERYSVLDEDRKAMIDRCFSPYDKKVSLVNFYECDEFIAVKNDEIIGVFNLTDEEKSLKKLFLQNKITTATDYFSGEIINTEKPLAPRSAIICRQ